MTDAIFTAEDIREYFYCPMIIWLRYVIKARERITEKMKEGKEIHEEIYKKLREKGYMCNVYLIAEDIKLKGIIDALKINGTTAEVLEVKLRRLNTRRKIALNYKMQLIAEKLLVEHALGVKVTKIGVYYADSEEIVYIQIVKEDETHVLNALKKMHDIVSNEIPPEIEPSEKCSACTLYPYCH